MENIKWNRLQLKVIKKVTFSLNFGGEVVLIFVISVLFNLHLNAHFVINFNNA